MGCPDFEFTPHGRQGIGVVQPQSGLDYPLVAPSDDIRYLLADFYLSYDDKGEYSPGVLPTQFPLRIKYLLNVGCAPSDLPVGAPVPVNGADIVIVDSRGAEILNTAIVETTFTKRDWGPDYCVYEWVTPDATCRLVAYTTWKTGEPAPQNYAQHLAPAAAELDARAVHKLPKRLRSLSVRQRNGTTKAGPYTGNVTFKNGYNTTLIAAETTTTSFIVNTRVTFSATAGSGAGYYSECGDNYDAENQTTAPQPIRTINGVGARTAGDFLMAASDCVYLRRPTTIVDLALSPSKTAQQQIGSDCVPCCACADYADTARYMNELRDKYSLIGSRAAVTNALHAENIMKWTDLRACTLKPLKLILAPQCCPTMDVIAMICNPCDKCYPPSVLSVSVDRAMQLVCGYTTLFKPDGSTTAPSIYTEGLSFAINMPSVPAGGSAYVKFRLKSPTQDAGTITATLSGVFADNTPIRTGCPNETAADARQPDIVIKSATLTCNSTGGDNRPCSLT